MKPPSRAGGGLIKIDQGLSHRRIGLFRKIRLGTLYQGEGLSQASTFSPAMQVL